MKEVSNERMIEHIASIRFPRPASDSEYWLFGSPAASADALRGLPAILEMKWELRDGNRVLVDFLDGPDSNRPHLYTWPEFSTATKGKHRFMVRWLDSKLPVRVLICPGYGVILEIENMDERELDALHALVVRGFVDPAIADMHTNPILIGCDSQGNYEEGAERLLGLGQPVSAPIRCPTYVLTSKEIADAGFRPESYETLQVGAEVTLLKGW